jgi:hypothetical protein
MVSDESSLSQLPEFLVCVFACTIIKVFLWEEKQEKVFHKIKVAISREMLLSFPNFCELVRTSQLIC